ncbi:MAG: hypothetical protein ABSC88_05220 [Terracidiphilus sp.]|jgi:hypothetical protein
MRHIKFIIIIPLFLLQIAHASGIDPSLRKLLSADDFDSPMIKIFSQGDSIISKLVVALDDPDTNVAMHAQFMLLLLGDEHGIQSLHQWYDRPRPILRIVNGPVPVPLSEWDFKQIEAILAHPSSEWKNEAENYFYALAIDRSTRAQELLKKMIEAIPVGDTSNAFAQMVTELKHCIGCATSCSFGTPQKMVQKNAFFFDSEEVKSMKIEVLGYANGNNLALLRLSQIMGNTFLVVLKRQGTCWQFQSVHLQYVS